MSRFADIVAHNYLEAVGYDRARHRAGYVMPAIDDRQVVRGISDLRAIQDEDIVTDRYWCR